MKLFVLIVLLSSSACSLNLLPFKRSASIPVYEASEGELLQPQRSVAQLLSLRLRICSAPASSRAAELEAQLPESAANEHPVDEQKLNALLLASCEPARTPGVLNQLLAQLTAAGTWPEEYAAFFDLLIAAQKAYASVEKVYLELEAEHQALQEEHERTILGLGEIESQIEAQSQQPVVQ